MVSCLHLRQANLQQIQVHHLQPRDVGPPNFSRQLFQPEEEMIDVRFSPLLLFQSQTAASAASSLQQFQPCFRLRFQLLGSSRPLLGQNAFRLPLRPRRRWRKTSRNSLQVMFPRR